MQLKWFKFKYELMMCIFLLFLLHAQNWIEYLIYNIFQMPYTTLSYIISILIYALSSITVIVVALYDQKKKLAAVCIIKKQKSIAWVAFFLCCIGFTLLYFYFTDLFYRLFKGWSTFDYYYEVSIDNLPYIIISSCLIPAVCEEITVKGIMFSRLEKQYSRITAVIICSVLFSALHLNPVRFIPIFIGSLCTFWLYIRTKNILLPIIRHFINNFLAEYFYGEVLAQPQIFLIAQIFFWIGLIALIGATEKKKERKTP